MVLSVVFWLVGPVLRLLRLRLCSPLRPMLVKLNGSLPVSPLVGLLRKLPRMLAVLWPLRWLVLWVRWLRVPHSALQRLPVLLRCLRGHQPRPLVHKLLHRLRSDLHSLLPKLGFPIVLRRASLPAYRLMIRCLS